MLPFILIMCLLTTHATPEKDIQTMIEDLGIKDNHFFNDIRKETYSGVAILGNEVVNVTFKVGKSFRGQVIEEESELIQKRVDSLKTSAVYIKYGGRGSRCFIRIGGGMLARNYLRFYRMTKEVEEEARPVFIKIKATRRSNGEKVMISLLQNVKQSKESAFKYLPYQLTHLPDLMMLTISQDIQARYFIKYEVTASDGCFPQSLQNVDKIERNNNKDDVGPSVVRDEHYTNGSKTILETETANIENGTEVRKIVMNSCNENIDIPDDVTTCYDVNDDLTATLRHLYMMSIQMQHLLLMRYYGNVADDTEVCSVTLDVDAASSTKANFEHTMVECCNVIIGRQKLFRVGELEQGWHCHDPYYLSRLLLQIVGYATYVILMLLPMAITVLPSVYEGSNNASDDADEDNITRTDAESIISEITGKRLRDVKISNTPSSGTPETLSLEEPDEENGTEKNVFVKAQPNPETSEKDTTASPKYDLIFVNEDPVYSFGLDNILWYLFLFNIKNHYLTVIRRLVFLYFLWTLHYLAAVQMYLFYINIYIYTWQAKFPSMWTFRFYDPKLAYDTEEKFHSVFFVYAMLVPAVFAVFQFAFLSPLLTDARSIAHALYWEERETDIGFFMEVDLVDNAYDFNLSYETRLVKNLSARLSYISKSKFWRYLFERAVFEVDLVKGRRRMISFSKVCFCVIKFIFILIIWPFYVIPFFTAFRVFFCGGKPNKGAVELIKMIIQKLSMVIGLLSLILLFLPLIFFYVCMFIFIIIDVLRNISSTLTLAIFILSVVGSFRESFLSLEDEYRTIKAAIFNIIESFADCENKEEQKYFNMLIWESESGDVAIPRVLFEKVCDLHMPFGENVFNVLVGLGRNLIFIALLYALIVDYQIFDQFSETGESIITVIFVSLPSLLSREKSEAELELGKREMEIKLKVLLLGILDGPEFWHELKGSDHELKSFVSSV